MVSDNWKVPKKLQLVQNLSETFEEDHSTDLRSSFCAYVSKR